MAEDLQYTYTIDISNFDVSLLPSDSRTPQTPEFREAVSRCMQKQFQPLGGKTKIVVDDTKITVVWTTTKCPDLVDYAIKCLNNGDYSTGITLLECALSADPENTNILYNLGMALSDKNELDRAIHLLEQSLELDSTLINAKVALGVALTRKNENEKACDILQDAVCDDPTNSYAQRNLGGCLIKLGRADEALPHLKKATELNAIDQAAWYGLGQVYETLKDHGKADDAYSHAIQIDEYSTIGDLARQKRSHIAQENFKSKFSGARPDAVMYCLAALKKFHNIPKSEVQKIAFEIGMFGTGGLNVNDPDSKYTLKSMQGTFSGLQLICYMYVGFKIVAPQMDVEFDLSKEYESANSLFNDNGNLKN